MKKFNKLLLAVVMVVTAFAASAFEVGDCAYEISNSTKRLVNCTGLSAQGKGKSSLALEIPGTVSYNGTTYRVYRIAQNAFANQSNLTGVSIRWGTKIINDGAFNGCGNITYLRMASSVQYVGSNAFIGCTKLKSVYYASYDTKPYTNYTSWINKGSGITLYLPKRSTLSASDITGMSNWANFTIDKTKEDVYDWYTNNAYWCAISLGSTDEQSPAESVDLCLTGFNNSVSTTFAPTSSYNYMNSADIKFVYKAIANSAFRDKTNVTSINLDKLTSLTTISGYAFYGCTALNELLIPASVTTLNPGSFIDGCTSLTNVVINSANTTYSSYSGMVYNKAQTILHRVPEGKSGALYDNGFPTGVTTFSNYAFYDCKKVTHIWVPYGVKSIGDQAFYNCTGLTQLKIPSSVTSMSSSALASAKITWCNVNLTTAPTVSNVGSISYLFVPYGATSSYTTAKGWNPTYGINPNGQQAFDAESGNIFYTVTSSASTTAINGSTYAGRAKVVCGSKTYNQTSATTVNIPDYIYVSGKSYAVTKIGEDAFNNNTGNITVTGCANVDTVGAYAFQNQPVIKYPFGHKSSRYIMTYAFDGAGLTGTIALPYGVQVLGNYAFGNGKYSRLIIPSSISNIYGDFCKNTTTLTELVLNFEGKTWYTYAGWDLGTVPSTCYIRVPVGRVQHYKNNSALSSRSSYITAGAYDFAYENSYNGSWHLTILSNSSTTFNGNTYAGTAKYVYYTSNPDKTGCGFDTYETDKTVEGDQRKYLITQIGDSCLAGAKSTTLNIPSSVTRIGDNAFYGVSTITTANLTLPSGLTYIGANAFRSTKLTGEIKIPSTVTSIGHDAFWNVPLTSIFFSGDKPGTLGADAWDSGSNAPNLTVWVKNEYAYKFLDAASNSSWSSGCKTRLGAWIQPTRSTVLYGSVLPGNFSSANINAYYASGYDKSNPTKQLTLTKANQAPENTGLLLIDLTPNKEYRIPRPTGSVSAPMTNYFVATPRTNTSMASVTVGYKWDYDANPKHFVKQTSTWYYGPSYDNGYGTAYLKLSSAEAINDVYTSLYPYTQPVGVPGDVNNDGKVDITDVNLVINMMLGKASYNAKGDMNNDGKIDITDVNLVINKMLGK